MERINFSTLEKNHELVKQLFGNAFYNKSLNDTLTTSEVLEANEELLKYQVGEYIANLIHNRNVPQINELMWQQLDRAVMMSYTNDPNDNCGLLVIRPEALWLENEILKWLEERKIIIIDSYYTSIDFWLHWYLYFMNLYGFEDRCDFPTRILNYNNQKLHAFIVKFSPNAINKNDIKKFLADTKGISGLYQQGSLRGEVAYNAFQKVITNCGKGLIREARIALDPIGIYRKISVGDLWCDNDCQKSKQPILFYSGLSVHIPDFKEYHKHKLAFSINAI